MDQHTPHFPLTLASDYQEGAHPAVMARLVETNRIAQPGYGMDEICTQAETAILSACGCARGQVCFMMGGTAANAMVIGSILRPWQGVLAADTGHISVHEAGAIEWGGHKVLTLPNHQGKITARQVADAVAAFYADEACTHMVHPGMVYISQPTEYGTLYTLEELTALSQACRAHHLPLYVDGARLAYALGSPESDVSLADLARLTDALYIGGTKCGALFGEAVVLPNPDLIPHFYTMMKQRGGMLAKGWLLGAQFDALFAEGLYQQIGRDAVAQAKALSAAFQGAGYEVACPTQSNQIFLRVSAPQAAGLQQLASFSLWEIMRDGTRLIRYATSWHTRQADVDGLIAALQQPGWTLSSGLSS